MHNPLPEITEPPLNNLIFIRSEDSKVEILKLLKKKRFDYRHFYSAL
jgi:hypothetical protein